MSWQAGAQPVEVEFEVSPRVVRSVRVAGLSRPVESVLFTPTMVRVLDDRGGLLTERPLPDALVLGGGRGAGFQRLIMDGEAQGQLERVPIGSGPRPEAPANLPSSQLNVSAGTGVPHQSASQRGQQRADAAAVQERRVMLGLTMVAPSLDLQGHLGLPPGGGVMVTGIYPETPAAAAMLKPFDVIELVGGQPATEESLLRALSQAQPGQELRLLVHTGGQRREMVVKLAAFDAAKLPEKPVAAWPTREGGGQAGQGQAELEADLRRQEALRRLAERSSGNRAPLPAGGPGQFAEAGSAGQSVERGHTLDEAIEPLLDFAHLHADAAAAQRLAALEQRLARMEATLEALAAHLARREQMPGRGGPELPPVRVIPGGPADKPAPDWTRAGSAG